jgi:hypothetical protein
MRPKTVAPEGHTYLLELMVAAAGFARAFLLKGGWRYPRFQPVRNRLKFPDVQWNQAVVGGSREKARFSKLPNVILLSVLLLLAGGSVGFMRKPDPSLAPDRLRLVAALKWDLVHHPQRQPGHFDSSTMGRQRRHSSAGGLRR